MSQQGETTPGTHAPGEHARHVLREVREGHDEELGWEDQLALAIGRLEARISGAGIRPDQAAIIASFGIGDVLNALAAADGPLSRDELEIIDSRLTTAFAEGEEMARIMDERS